MEKVVGIGGVFMRAKDPDALMSWYTENLGINPTPTTMEMEPWRTTEGVVVFAPWPEDTDYFPSHQRVMINFRVADMDAMLAQLKASGIEARNHQTMEGIGRFAHIDDPEGNAIELWEPAV